MYKVARFQLTDLRQAFETILAECLICFKDPSYKEEQEWRAIMITREPTKLKQRASGGRIVPYIELGLGAPKNRKEGQLPIESITYGPTLEVESTESSLRMLFDSSGYTKPAVKIKKSGIPFRSLG
jgi:hypothetical protein